MPLLVAQRGSHGVVLDHSHSGTTQTEQPLDFTMSKFKTSTRHQLYRQFYGAEESPPYDKHEEQGKILSCIIKKKNVVKLWFSALYDG